ncbi:MAG: DinB family protein [Candidatus Dormibacteria bacterium]
MEEPARRQDGDPSAGTIASLTGLDGTAADAASQILAARDRLVEFAESCDGAAWSSVPADGGGRSVATIVDHVGHAYEYLAGWILELSRGAVPEVTRELVDSLNEEHARLRAGVTRDQAVRRLRESGDALGSLVAGLSPEQYDIADGRVRRFAEIATRHAESHLAEVSGTA